MIFAGEWMPDKSQYICCVTIHFSCINLPTSLHQELQKQMEGQRWRWWALNVSSKLQRDQHNVN